MTRLVHEILVDATTEDGLLTVGTSPPHHTIPPWQLRAIARALEVFAQEGMPLSPVPEGPPAFQVPPATVEPA